MASDILGWCCGCKSKELEELTWASGERQAQKQITVTT